MRKFIVCKRVFRETPSYMPNKHNAYDIALKITVKLDDIEFVSDVTYNDLDTNHLPADFIESVDFLRVIVKGVDMILQFEKPFTIENFVDMINEEYNETISRTAKNNPS